MRAAISVAFDKVDDWGDKERDLSTLWNYFEDVVYILDPKNSNNPVGSRLWRLHLYHLPQRLFVFSTQFK